MIEGVVIEGNNGYQIENDVVIADEQIEDFNFMIDSSFSGLESSQGQNTSERSIAFSAMDYVTSTKTSLVNQSLGIKEDLHGSDKTFSFQDKLNMLERSYNYQLEMTFYNTFMQQTLTKTDALIQLK